MSEYFHIVPWYNSNEWRNVYDKLYSPSTSLQNKEEALDTLLVWKARCPSLPAGVESTLTLLEVSIQDEKNYDGKVNEQLLRLAYASAIMRFVNHMLDTETAKGTSLYQAAKQLGIPDWIIDMRHDTAHNNILPTVRLLREATVISLDWLQKNYWDKHKECLNNYISGQKETDPNDEHKIAALMNFCISLSVCAHSKCNIKNLAEIPDVNLRESIVNDARDLFGGHLDFSNLKTISVLALINTVNLHAKRLLKSGDTVSHMNKALLSEDSLFLSLDLLSHMGDREFYNKNQLSRHFVQCFEVLLTFLHTNNLLLDLIMELIKLTQCGEPNSHRCLLSALWVSEILKAIRKSKQFLDKVNKTTPDDRSAMKRKELKQLYHHWFPNEKYTALLLDLQKPVPRELQAMSFIKPIISTYNPYLTFFIRDLLNLVEPRLPKIATEKIHKLAKLISFKPNYNPARITKIFTVEDVMLTSGKNSQAEESDLEILNESTEFVVQNGVIDNNVFKSGIWHLASGNHSWATCPVGLLPWQKMEDVHVPMET